MAIYVDFSDPINDYCEALSFSFGTQTGRVAGGANHAAQSHDVALFKETDDISHALFIGTAQGTVFPRVVVEFWKGDSCVVMYTLLNVVISSYSQSRGGESVHLDYESMSARYFEG